MDHLVNGKVCMHIKYRSGNPLKSATLQVIVFFDKM